MDCPLSWIYSLAQRWTGFQVWRIYAWGGGFSQLSTALVSLPCHLKFHTAPHKAFRLDSTVALRVFIRRHGKLKQTLRSAPIYERPWWQCIATKRVDRSEMCIWVRNCVLFYFFLFFFPTAAEFFNVEHPLKPSLESDTVWPCQTKSRQRSLTRVQNIYR